VTRVGWKYYATAEYEDHSKERIVIRFPSKGWWLVTLTVLLSPLYLASGPRRLKDGWRVWQRPDGVIEFREPWRE
jgi:hypothetical protein